MRVTVNASLSVQASKRIACGVDDGIVVDEGTPHPARDGFPDEIAGPRAFAEKQEPVWRARCIVSAPWMGLAGVPSASTVALPTFVGLIPMPGRSVALRWAQRASFPGEPMWRM